MQDPATARAGASLEQRFGNATAAHGGFLFQGNVQGNINLPGKSVFTLYPPANIFVL
jgi:hypothetical protein